MDNKQKHTRYGVLVDELDGKNIKEWIKVRATAPRSVN